MNHSDVRTLASRWSQLITENKEDQQNIADKVIDTLQSPQTKKLEDLEARFQKVRDKNPEFLEDLFFVVGGLGSETEDKPCPPGTNDKPELGSSSTMQEQSNKPLAQYSSDEIRQICGRYNLMSLESFLQVLNRINMATSGNLLRDQPKATGQS